MGASKFNDREVAPGHPAVERRLAGRLRDGGRITFAEFMEIALYDPEGGYYARHGAGRDYRTAPQTSPAFGHLVGRAAAVMWRALGDPARFDLVELGAGDGRLAHDVLAYLDAREPAAAAAIGYLTLDCAHSARGSRAAACVAEATALPLRGVVGCVLSNELFDALPVHRLVRRADELRELWVTDDGGYRFVAGELSDPALAAELAARGVFLTEGQVADLAPAAGVVMNEIARTLARGFVLTIDYGGGAADLYGPHRRAGTLLAYHRHRVSDRPLARPGEQDLTSHVDFDYLRRVGEAAGLTTLVEMSQRELLRGLGLRDWLDRLDPTQLTPADLFNARAAVAELVDPRRLGGFRALVQARGVDDVPAGLRGG